MSEFIEGPWEVTYELQKDGTIEAFEIKASWAKYPFLSACSCCNGTHIDEPSVATAILIGAAPDLFEAAIAALEEMRNTTSPRNSFTDAVDALDAAITKARGES